MALKKLNSCKILVCGGRNFNNKDFIFNSLDRLFSDTLLTVVHGGATGVDSIANEWATQRNHNIKAYPIHQEEWNTYGKKAGYLRNKKMLDLNPDINLVIAFDGGSGTKMMITLASQRNIKVVRLSEEYAHEFF